MKIGILTFHCAANFGAVLQAYGLQESLKKLGHKVCILDYRPKYLLTPYRNWNYRPHKKGFNIIKEAIRASMIYPSRKHRNYEFQKFIHQFLQLSPYNEIINLDAIIVGSDQVWNPIITGGRPDDVYLLANASDNQLKVSYAASVGNLKYITTSFNDDIKKKLRRFNHISVRETELEYFFRNKKIKDATTVLDPVLLAGKETFENIVDNHLAPSEPYLFYFSLQANPVIEKYAQKIANSRGLKIISMCSMDDSPLKKSFISSGNPIEFLSLIKNARFVVSNSFHGTAFAVLFNTDFVSVWTDKAQSSRVLSLLTSLGLTDRFILTSENNNKKTSTIDFEKVNHNLQKMRTDSYTFINQAIPPQQIRILIAKGCRKNNSFICPSPNYKKGLEA